jgi:hypothetical protein
MKGARYTVPFFFAPTPKRFFSTYNLVVAEETPPLILTRFQPGDYALLLNFEPGNSAGD